MKGKSWRVIYRSKGYYLHKHGVSVALIKVIDVGSKVEQRELAKMILQGLNQH